MLIVQRTWKQVLSRNFNQPSNLIIFVRTVSGIVIQIPDMEPILIPRKFDSWLNGTWHSTFILMYSVCTALVLGELFVNTSKCLVFVSSRGYGNVGHSAPAVCFNVLGHFEHSNTSLLPRNHSEVVISRENPIYTTAFAWEQTNPEE